MNAPAATAAPAASPAAPAWACSGAGAALPQHKRRIRLAMYLAFAALALAVAVQGLLTWQLEAVRAADLELLDRAGGQREVRAVSGIMPQPCCRFHRRTRPRP